MGHTVEKLKTLGRLGPANIIRVAAYRARLKLPVSKIRKVADTGADVSGPFFKNTGAETPPKTPTRLPKLFGFHDIGETATPPNWLTNPLNGQTFPNGNRPFYAIADFDPNVGDIKQVWELSRFQWVLTFAQEGKRKPEHIQRLNDWVEDWTKANPAYQGPNWKCGQEASLRVLHLVVGAYIIGDAETPLIGLQDLIHLHLKRIAPTTSYAMAQDNNHGTSEAAALYIGGTWLASLGHPEAQIWARKGRQLLENRAAKLIKKDGSFSQYSLTYHRMMLDSLSLCEWWRDRIDEKPFSLKFQSKAKAASSWLYRLVDPSSGDAPNLGANDGAHILNLANVDYRDFRPSVALAYALWHEESAFNDNVGAQAQLRALNIQKPEKKAEALQGDPGLNGGFSVLKTTSALALLRCPRFTFRPSQSDILHLDFWHNGQNILCDGGTYSYNSTDEDLDYFGGVRSHNSIAFDERDQMPRLGRFLFGAWPETTDFFYNETQVTAEYKDYLGAYHKRSVSMSNKMLSVTDDIAGFQKTAVLRWRFNPSLNLGQPSIVKTENGFTVDFGVYQLEISGDSPTDAAWETGAQSLYYLYKNPLPVLVITANKAGSIQTRLRWVN